MTATVPTTSLALALLRKEVAAKSGENVIISPLSITTALGMTANGARGDTLNGIVKALGLTTSDIAQINAAYKALLATLRRPGLGVTLDIANGIFARQGIAFNPAFLDVNTANFGALVKSMDFDSQDAVDFINNWVSDNTKKKIQGILKGGIDANTIMFIINAVYFKGEWNVKFDKSLTKTETFAAAGGNIQHPLMYRNDEMVYGNDWDNGVYEYVSLPFGDSKAVRMVVLLPGNGKAPEDVLEVLTVEKLDQIGSQNYSSEGELWLPRVEIEYGNDLKDSLIALGMDDAFDSTKADLTGLYSGDGNAFIKRVKHGCVFKVDEEGAEGAAYTSVEVGLECISRPFAMRVDRPFVKFVVDSESKSVLFAGVVNNPDGAKKE